MMSNHNSTKQKIEKHLMVAMGNLDSAVFEIGQNLPDTFGTSAALLSNCKKDIKMVLNKHFDQLARNKFDNPKAFQS